MENSREGRGNLPHYFLCNFETSIAPSPNNELKAFEEWLGEKYFYLLQMQLYGLNNSFFASHI
jgi:hypothetical protein